MTERGISSNTAFWLFILLAVYVFVQTIWWIVLMARLVDEKVDLAEKYGADPSAIEQLLEEETHRQIMVGLEGVVFLILIIFGAWLIYRALIKTRELTFHQQNFLMAVTHELKTPLASTKLYLDSLRSPKISQERKLAILPKIGEDLSRLEKLVENILDAGRFERSGYRLNKSTFNLTRLIDEVLDEAEKAPLSVPLTVNRDLGRDVEVYADRAALRRAIGAVVDNALRYNDKDEIRVDVTLTTHDEDITLRVEDNGVGLQGREVYAVFDRFYRVGHEMQREHSGTGLGLYLCREIIRAHGGDIYARSGGQGRGTTFTIEMKAGGRENNSPR